MKNWANILLFSLSFGILHSSEPSGFTRPLVTITVDDGWESAYEYVAPALKWYGYKATFFLYTAAIGQRGYVTKEQVVELHQAGHEIGAHSIEHSDLAKELPSMVEDQLSKPKMLLEGLLEAPVVDFAAPYGSVSPMVLKLIPKYYQSNRSVVEGFNTKDSFNRYQIKIQLIRSTTTLEEFDQWLKTAQNNHWWLVLSYHQVDGGKGYLVTTPEKIEEHMKAIKERQLAVVTIKEGLQEVMGQILEEIEVSN